jgi:hypothetical protein
MIYPKVSSLGSGPSKTEGGTRKDYLDSWFLNLPVPGMASSFYRLTVFGILSSYFINI